MGKRWYNQPMSERTGRKSLLITSEYPPNTSGGIQRTATSFVDYCTRQEGSQVTWIFPFKNRKSVRPELPKNNGLIYEPIQTIADFPLFEKIPNRVSSARLSKVLEHSDGYLVIHSPDTIGMAVSKRLDLTQRKRTTIVWNCPLGIKATEVDFSSLKDYIAYLATHPLYGLRNSMLEHEGLVQFRAVFNSQLVKHTFQQIFPQANPIESIVIPPATEYCHHCHLEKKKQPKEFVVLTVGRVTAKKGTGRLLEIALRLEKMLENTNKNVKFVIAGDIRSPYGRWLVGQSEKMNRSLHHCSFELRGYVPDGDPLCRVYNDADIFLLPSTIEGFGLVFAEAAAHGLSLAGFNSRGSAEVIPQFGPAGYLVQSPNNRGYDQLASHIRDLVFLPPESRKQISDHAQHNALKLFSPNKINAQLLDFVSMG